MLATVRQVKGYVGIAAEDETDDDLIAAILAGVSQQMAKAAGRAWRGQGCLELMTWDAETPLLLNVPDRWTRSLLLPAWPIVSVDCLQQSTIGDWANAPELVEDEDFRIDAAAGRLIHQGWWLPGDLTVRIEYVGGYTPPDVYGEDGYEAEDGEVNLPADLQEAAVRQAAAVFGRRASLGLTNISGGGGAAGLAAAGVPLLEDVAEMCRTYRRIAI